MTSFSLSELIKQDSDAWKRTVRMDPAELKRLAKSDSLTLQETELLYREVLDSEIRQLLVYNTKHAEFLAQLLYEADEKIVFAAARNTTLSPEQVLRLRPDSRAAAQGLTHRSQYLPEGLLDRIVEMPKPPSELINQKNLSIEATRLVLEKLVDSVTPLPLGTLMMVAQCTLHPVILCELSLREQNADLVHAAILQNELMNDGAVAHQVAAVAPAVLDEMTEKQKGSLQQWLWENVAGYDGMPVEWAYKLLNGSQAAQ